MPTPIVIGDEASNMMQQLTRDSNFYSLKIATVDLNAVDTAAGVFAWQNPLNFPIIVKRVTLNVTTESAGACTVDVGQAATAVLSDDLIDGLDVAAAAIMADNIGSPGTNGQQEGQIVLSTEFITGSVASGASAGIIGKAIIEYIPTPA